MLLLIPGPVNTQPAVRAALAQDFAPWDNAFRAVVAAVRARILPIAGTSPATHAALPLQGCGHFAIEAAIRSFVPPGGRLLVPATGAYANRMIRLAREAGREAVSLEMRFGDRVDPAALEAALAADPAAGHVGLVYSETGSGVVHDVPALARVAGRAGRRVILDAVSAFGALPLDLSAQPEIDAAVFTPNKCLEAVAGVAFAVARIDRLRAGRAGSWSFDLGDVYEHGLRNGEGSFRFTPAPQVIAALAAALDLYDAEGGQPARLARYEANLRCLYDGVRALGLTPWLTPATQGPVVMNVRAPIDPSWNLQAFVDALNRRGVLISNFYNTPEPGFRVGCIGAVTPDDMARAVRAMDAALAEIGVARRAAA
jgi:2-aminoethylphosphonate-pyruvate transaminase